MSFKINRDDDASLADPVRAFHDKSRPCPFPAHQFGFHAPGTAPAHSLPGRVGTLARKPQETFGPMIQNIQTALNRVLAGSGFLMALLILTSVICLGAGRAMADPPYSFRQDRRDRFHRVVWQPICCRGDGRDRRNTWREPFQLHVLCL